MRFLIISGSPRKNGNTQKLLKPFTEELEAAGAETDVCFVSNLDIKPCIGCRSCQKVSGSHGCIQKDDMTGGENIIERMLAADCIVFATPIYTWFCTPAVKAVMDRSLGFGKYSGQAERISLLGGKKTAIVATHGDDAKNAVTPYESVMKNYSEYYGMEYLGLYSVRDEGGLVSFTAEDAVDGAREFARYLADEVSYAAENK